MQRLGDCRALVGNRRNPPGEPRMKPLWSNPSTHICDLHVILVKPHITNAACKSETELSGKGAPGSIWSLRCIRCSFNLRLLVAQNKELYCAIADKWFIGSAAIIV